MKIKINRNILWAQTFVNKLADLGLNKVCISPGSRCAPLVIAFASNKKIKSYVHVDERSSGFFALGLAKKTNNPVAIVTTSGTAVAELYPAIIEAYQQRIPLIVCTADRPPELLNTGANQTINQKNIYQNHIRRYFDAGLPEVNIRQLQNISLLAQESFYISTVTNPGPVHINFPFKKPFESFNYTDEVDEKMVGSLENLKIHEYNRIVKSQFSKKNITELSKKIMSQEKGFFLLGPETYNDNFLKLLSELSNETGYPIIVDGASNARFSGALQNNMITNHTAFFRSRNFTQKYDPELIIHFGSAPTSNITLKIFELSKAEKIMVNEFGDWKDPSRTASQLIKTSPVDFCQKLLGEFTKNDFSRKLKNWISSFEQVENHTEKSKENIIESAEFPFEGRIVTELFKWLPKKANLMISNSVPIRDVDFFASKSDKNINVYTNRGASGIDGIISTAAGIASQSKEPTFLLIGDLSFYHDLNGLLALKKYSIPLNIILINNAGGGIFGFLPVKNEKKYFNEFFRTNQDIPFSKIIQAYGGEYLLASDWEAFKKWIFNSHNQKKFSVIEFVTNSKKSLSIRMKYWKKAVQLTDKIVNDN